MLEPYLHSSIRLYSKSHLPLELSNWDIQLGAYLHLVSRIRIVGLKFRFHEALMIYSFIKHKETLHLLQNQICP
jgi:hypothetical protein